MPSKPPPGHFRVLYFAAAASFTKKESDNFPAPIPVNQLFNKLEVLYPGIGQAVLNSAAFTINLEYVDLSDQVEGITNPHLQYPTIREADEVAIIPPVSSG